MTLVHTPAHTIHHPDTFVDEQTGLTYLVEPDCDAEDPRNWHDSERVALWAYREPRLRRTHTPLPDGNLAIDLFAELFARHGDEEFALALTRRWLAIFVPDAGIQITTATIRGYSQGDWLDVVCAVAQGHGTPEAFIDQFRMWAFGDVWRVGVEGRFTVGGIYADDPEAAVEVFRKDFEETPAVFEHNLTLQVSAPNALAATRAIEQIIGAIHESDALPARVVVPSHLVVTSVNQGWAPPAQPGAPS